MLSVIGYLNTTVQFHLVYLLSEYFKNAKNETIKWQNHSIYETVTKFNQQKYLAEKFQENKKELVNA